MYLGHRLPLRHFIELIFNHLERRNRRRNGCSNTGRKGERAKTDAKCRRLAYGQDADQEYWFRLSYAGEAVYAIKKYAERQYKKATCSANFRRGSFEYIVLPEALIILSPL